MKIVNLTCEQLMDIPVVDVPAPRLSWQIRSSRNGVRQTAYQVLAASAAEKLDVEDGDLWDSGKVPDAANVLVSYGGRTPGPRRKCFWKVRIWDAADKVSAWSAPAAWMTGMSGGPWPGEFIAMPRPAGDPEHPLLRKTFNLPRDFLSAHAWVNALGYCELYLNGAKTDGGLLMPGPAQFDQRSLYVAHDVTSHLRVGENVCGLWLGRGWYVPGFPGVACEGPVVRAFVEIVFRDGQRMQVVTDGSWKACASHFSRLGHGGCGHYGGEKVDGRRMIHGWSEPGCDDVQWTPVALPVIPPHKTAVMSCEPNRPVRVLHPCSIRPYDGQDVWLVDFGQNLAGIFRMRFDRLAAGREVCFEFADHIDAAGKLQTFNQRGMYVACGEPGEVYENRFNYHAFRYVRVQGLPDAPRPADMQAELVRTAYPVQSAFACSHPLLNKIHDMTRHTLECLTIGGYMVDCPHVERMGYGGDGLSSTPTAMIMFGLGPFYANWMAHWRDVQRPDGGLPHTAPCFNKRGGGPYWCAFVIGAPWQAYLQYADRRILDDNYSMMQQWLDGYVGAHRRAGGLLWDWPKVPYRNWYLGDWARPGQRESQAERSVHLVTNCALVQCFGQMAQIAAVLNRVDDAVRYAAEGDVLRGSIHDEFYDPARTTYADDTQLDLAYPLLIDAVPSELQHPMIERLAHKILVEHDGHLDVGLVGVPVLAQTLGKLERHDLVYALVTKKTFPGWGHMLAEGATTTWEHWDGKRSHIHNCYNGIGEWFYTGIAGIQPLANAPGYKEFVLHPRIVGDLSWAHACKMTPFGMIESFWRIDDNRVFHWHFSIPSNSTARVVFPTASLDAIHACGGESGAVQPLEPPSGSEQRIVTRLNPGNYDFEIDLGRE